jgi:hypothetical protein
MATPTTATRIIYWAFTGLVCLMMIMSGGMMLFNPESAKVMDHLGFPHYFLTELGIAKLLGVVALAVPMVPAIVKEWAYAGFAITFISASIAHGISGDGPAGIFPPLVTLGFLLASRFYYEKVRA